MHIFNLYLSLYLAKKKYHRIYLKNVYRFTYKTLKKNFVKFFFFRIRSIWKELDYKINFQNISECHIYIVSLGKIFTIKTISKIETRYLPPFRSDQINE